MPKNLSTVGGATELRFGKNCREDQHNNSVVINASNDKIDATKAGGFYLTPLELTTVFASDGTDATTNTFVAYNQSTKQLFRTEVPVSITGISSAGAGAEGDLNVNGNLYVTGNVTSIGTVARGRRAEAVEVVAPETIVLVEAASAGGAIAFESVVPVACNPLPTSIPS